MNKHYYFAYGMNTNRLWMKSRCPAAISIGSAMLANYEFRFAYHADVVPKLGAKTVGVLWELTDKCLASLDRLESYPTYYDRVIVPIIHRDRVYNGWVYTMQPGNLENPPGDGYWDCLMEGYKEHNVSRRQLHTALNHSRDSIKNGIYSYDWHIDRYVSH